MWQGLDYEEINHAIEKIEKEDAIIIDTNEFYQGALWAEQRLKEKNQPIEEQKYLYVWEMAGVMYLTKHEHEGRDYALVGKIKLD